MRAVALSLFLARIGPDALPVAFAASAFTAIGVSFLTKRALRYLPPNYCAAASWLLLAGATVALEYLTGAYHHSLIVIGLLYVLVEVRGSLNTIHVVTLTNDAFANSDSKRPFAIVASGAPVAGIIVGLILGIEASVLNMLAALILIAGIDVVTCIVVLFCGTPSQDEIVNANHTEREEVEEPEEQETKDRNLQNYRFNISALVALKIAVLTLIGFQWEVAVANYYGNDETRLVAYFALFYAISDILIFLLQWIASGKLLDRFGIGVGLKGFPIALVFIGIAAVFSQSIPAMMIVFTIAKGFNVMRRAIHDPSLAVAYSTLDPTIRRETIVIVKGMIKPFAEAASASLLLAVGTLLMESQVTYVWLTLILPWLYFAAQTTRLYKRQSQTGLTDPVSVS